MRRSTQDGSAGESGNSEAGVGNGSGQLVSSGSHDKSVAGDIADNASVTGSYDFNGEDYLELNDLYSLGTSSASSDNSSRVSLNSDEYFNADALLREIENDRLIMQEEHAGCKLSISTPVEPNQVVITMPPQGSVLRNDNPAGKEKRASTWLSSSDVPVLRSRSEGSLADQKVTSSKSSGSRSSSHQGSPKSISRIAKLGKRYCCFGSF